MSTQIIEFDRGAFGLLEQPAQPRADPLCVILLNPGFIDHRGPFRLHVRLARALAAKGLHAVRLDAPGLGDNLPRSAEPLLQTSLATLDAIERHSGCRRFVVGGLCSAADLAWQMAQADTRIVGLLQIDGLLRKGLWYQWGRALRVMRKPPRDWLSPITRRLRERAGNRSAPGVAVSDDALRDWPAAGSERAEFATLVARGVEMFWLYTGGASYALHPRQFAGTYGSATRSAQVSLAYWPDCDHTFFVERHRRRLIDAVVAWSERRFDARGTAAPTTDRM